MDTAIWQQKKPIENLLRSPHRFNFFQAVRLLRQTSTRDKKKHTLYFRANLGLNFAFADITHLNIDNRDDQNTINLYQSFMGLCGQNAVLPEHYMELLLLRLEDKDDTLADFFDIFNHRMISLFYQSWQQSHFYVDYEKENHLSPDNTALSLIAALTGCHAPKTPTMNDETLLYYAGIYQQRVRSKEGLCMILSDYFELPFSLNEYQGEWIELNKAEQTMLKAHPHEHNNNLGSTTLLGKRIWQLQYHFTVLIGPLNYQQFMAHLPNGNILNLIKTIIGDYVGQEFDFHITLCLNASEIEHCQLRQTNPHLLGWNSWLSSKSCQHYNEKVSLSRDIISSFAKSNHKLNL